MVFPGSAPLFLAQRGISGHTEEMLTGDLAAIKAVVADTTISLNLCCVRQEDILRPLSLAGETR